MHDKITTGRSMKTGEYVHWSALRIKITSVLNLGQFPIPYFPLLQTFFIPQLMPIFCEPSWPAMAILKSGFLRTYVEKINVRMFLKNRLLGARLFFGAHMGIDWISGNNLLVENSSMNHQSSLGMKTDTTTLCLLQSLRPLLIIRPYLILNSIRNMGFEM